MTQLLLQTIETAAASSQLTVLGVVAPHQNDPVLKGAKSVVLFGPKEPGFWQFFQQQPEFMDRLADPMDRWSERVLSKLAAKLGGQAVYPFGGPPYAPFISWAARSGHAWSSPVGLLVHDQAGLFLSFRGAICFTTPLTLGPTGQRPCDTCEGQPCLTACPVGALSGSGYDLAACHAYLDSSGGRDCMDRGCAVRRACPVSKSYDRQPEQSSHHMKAFHP